MKDTKNKIINYLETYCYGKINIISKDKLAKVFDISTRELRKLKREIVIKDKIPIISLSKGEYTGYFYASNDLEVMAGRNEHLSRLLSHKEMVDAYENIINQKDQMSMI